MTVGIIEYRYYEQQENDWSIDDEEIYSLATCKVLVTNHPNCKKSPNTIVLNHTNKGKDIGSKLIGIDYMLSTGKEFDILLLLHDKRSPHSPLKDYWFRELTKIFRPPYASKLLNLLQKPEVGICCAKNYIKSEYRSSTKTFDTPNDHILQSLIQNYNLTKAKPYSFVAGTIFGCKWKPVKDFFTKYSPLEIREALEPGNVQDMGNGTLTHSWERLFSWLITSQGYSIKGVEQ
jgi:hypothetical protein